MTTVLIVDDDQPTQQLLIALMRRNGFSTAVASNGAEAIQLVRAMTFAVIILDLMMPTVDGLAVIEFLTKEKLDIPVILCTAAGPRSVEAVRSPVVKAVVRKPFDIERLSEIVSNLVTLRPR